ncbi:hydrogenase nickel incorporation protein HypB [Chitinibacter tainanensis]|uniref:hydrogenase nickel incorporation protein HypB n=1 Tax=Chitinibacter tainanensis TaxID=230667 RepID=UPI00054DA304|nr:hydrogenase nickel incorporation protein HypB [Chitinibacter tainanensis]
MCTSCGCGHGETRINGLVPPRRRRGAGPSGAYRLAGGVPTQAEPAPPATTGPLGAVHAPEVDPERTIRLEIDILASNDGQAGANRARLAAQQIFALNLVSSPGSGKTTLLVETLRRWVGAAAVIEGDQQTDNDAERIRATGVPAVQINTGKGCHLDAHMVAGALDVLQQEGTLAANSLLLIENVGNLVCPAAFDLGEAHKVAILSVTEGEDKPLKYPDLFRAADLLLLSKTDLLPYVDFNVEAAIAMARQVRPDLPVIQLSSKTGAGFAEWQAWLLAGCRRAQQRG